MAMREQQCPVNKQSIREMDEHKASLVSKRMNVSGVDITQETTLYVGHAAPEKIIWKTNSAHYSAL